MIVHVAPWTGLGLGRPGELPMLVEGGGTRGWCNESGLGRPFWWFPIGESISEGRQYHPACMAGSGERFHAGPEAAQQCWMVHFATRQGCCRLRKQVCVARARWLWLEFSATCNAPASFVSERTACTAVQNTGIARAGIFRVKMGRAKIKPSNMKRKVTRK